MGNEVSYIIKKAEDKIRLGICLLLYNILLVKISEGYGQNIVIHSLLIHKIIREKEPKQMLLPSDLDCFLPMNDNIYSIRYTLYNASSVSIVQSSFVILDES